MKQYRIPHKAASLIIAACALLMAFICFAAESKNANEGIFRLHIIANSNSEIDQRVKLLVRDALLEYEAENLSYANDASKTRDELMAQGKDVLNVIREVLNDNGADYPVQLKVGNYPFPDREYAGNVYPAGNYDALRVVLGEGKGDNWWCVMFPPLCIVQDYEGEVNTEEGVVFKSFFGELIQYLFGGKIIWNAKAEN